MKVTTCLLVLLSKILWVSLFFVCMWAFLFWLETIWVRFAITVSISPAPYAFRQEIYGGLLPNNPYFGSNGAIPGPKSFKCRCHYPINCVPEDGYEVILQYDNRKGKTPITLTYTKTIGLSLSAAVQKSFSVSNTTTSTISRHFWWRFSRTNTWSQTTTYDWSVKVAADFSVTTSLASEIKIQPGSHAYVFGI